MLVWLVVSHHRPSMTHHDTWLTDWLTQPLSAHPVEVHLDTEAMLLAIQVYREWHERGGLERLQRQAIRQFSDADRVRGAINETWLDIRGRMTNCVARAAAGRTVPMFQTVREVEKYHWVQLRLRCQGRWSRERRDVPVLELEVPCASRIESLVAARQSILPLHFAVRWTLVDVPHRVVKKDTTWWWAMLRHSLNLEKQVELGGARNDPTEVLDRLRIRLAFAQGLRPWLDRWSADQPGWSSLHISLPEHRPDHHSVAAVLPMVRGVAGDCLDDLGLEAGERLGIEKLLIRGATVRTNLSRFTGSDRRARVSRLAEQLGTVTCRRMMTSVVLSG